MTDRSTRSRPDRSTIFCPGCARQHSVADCLPGLWNREITLWCDCGAVLSALVWTYKGTRTTIVRATIPPDEPGICTPAEIRHSIASFLWGSSLKPLMHDLEELSVGGGLASESGFVAYRYGTDGWLLTWPDHSSINILRTPPPAPPLQKKKKQHPDTY